MFDIRSYLGQRNNVKRMELAETFQQMVGADLVPLVGGKGRIMAEAKYLHSRSAPLLLIALVHWLGSLVVTASASLRFPTSRALPLRAELSGWRRGNMLVSSSGGEWRSRFCC